VLTADKEPEDVIVGVAAVTVRINSPLTIDKVAVVFAAIPDPAIVRVPIVPLTPAAEEALAINLYVPTANAVEVVTFIGALFKAKAPALAPDIVNGAVAPPSYAVNSKPLVDPNVIPLVLVTAIVPVALLPVAEAFKV